MVGLVQCIKPLYRHHEMANVLNRLNAGYYNLKLKQWRVLSTHLLCTFRDVHEVGLVGGASTRRLHLSWKNCTLCNRWSSKVQVKRKRCSAVKRMFCYSTLLIGMCIRVLKAISCPFSSPNLSILNGTWRGWQYWRICTM